MAKLNLVTEHFESIQQMLNAINSRTNNSIMGGHYSSQERDKDFTGTEDWKEAVELFEKGYTDVLSEIKDGVANGLKFTTPVTRRRTSTGVVGYAPHVPNAILGLPNSMIYTQSTPQKVKAVSICYCICSNCRTNAQEFVDSGIAVLNVINRLELNGCRVNLKIMFFNGEEGNDYAVGTVDVKSYREHMDLQKLAFPVAHPSMFRRFGFKWLETCNGLKDSSWSWGYGKSRADGMVNEKMKKIIKDNEYYMDLKFTKRYDYDADKIIESMNLK